MRRVRCRHGSRIGRPMMRLRFPHRLSLAGILGVACISACTGNVTTTEAAAGAASGATTTGASGAGGGGGSGGHTCVSDSDCELLEVCIYADGQCGAGEPKTCTPFPGSCPALPISTYCGCDGHSHGAVCFAEVDTGPGACPPPPGGFWCAEADCALATEYCLATPGGASCEGLPAACNDPSADCSCLEPLEAGCTCTQATDGHFELQCSAF